MPVKTKRIKRLIRVIASLLGFALFLAAASVAVFIYLNSPPPVPSSIEGSGFTLLQDDFNTSVIIEVGRGETALSVGQRLARAGLIRNRYFWQGISRLSREHIRTGTFLIDLPASQLAIRSVLVSGRQMMIRVTIPEGFTIGRTAALLEEMNITPARDFIAAASDPAILSRYGILGASMEGFLFPDTYLFPLAYPAERVVRAMADNFFARIAEIDESLVSMPMEELNRIITLASIVEREYRVVEEAPLMAGVFQNRLNIGMALQSCATVEYIITEILGRPHPEIITFRDIAIDNPFNTYIHPGLPPGPICSPGSISIRAALFPAETNYLFFRLRNQATGVHTFSRTYAEHVAAGRLFERGW